jgi:hypothetical protein
MIVRGIDLSLDRLERANSEVSVCADRGVGLPSHCRLECTVRPDVAPAICAVHERAVGQILGELKDGTPRNSRTLCRC